MNGAPWQPANVRDDGGVEKFSRAHVFLAHILTGWQCGGILPSISSPVARATSVSLKFFAKFPLLVRVQRTSLGSCAAPQLCMRSFVCGRLGELRLLGKTGPATDFLNQGETC
jgi:hypothetical protein